MNNITINFEKENFNLYKYIIENLEQENKAHKVLMNSRNIIVSFEDDSILEKLSIVISKFIVYKIEPEIIKKEAELICFGLFDEEIKDLIEKSIWELHYKNKTLLNIFIQSISDDILDKLQLNQSINLNGFMKFKYKERTYVIKEIINILLEEFFENDIDDQFINTLKKYISIQKNEIDFLNIIFFDLEEYKFYSKEKELIDISELEKIINKLIIDHYDPVEHFQSFISILMSLSPENIKIHQNIDCNPYFTQSLKKLYDERIELCYDCDFCRKEKNSENKEV